MQRASGAAGSASDVTTTRVPPSSGPAAGETAAGGKALDIRGGVGGQEVDVHQKHGGPNQQWEYDLDSKVLLCPSANKVRHPQHPNIQ